MSAILLHRNLLFSPEASSDTQNALTIQGRDPCPEAGRGFCRYLSILKNKWFSK